MSEYGTAALRAAFLLVLLASAGAQANEDLEELLEGVTELAGPGSPGGVIALSPGAFVVVAGRSGVPVAAAAREGKGRAMVLGHGGYLGKGTFAVADTGRFFTNSLRWLSGGKRKPLVACPGNDELAEAIATLGVRTTTEAELRGVDCVVFGGERQLSRRRADELRAFVRKGGGLLSAATGWGWQQLHANEQLARDLPGNRLFVPLGLGWSLETAGKTSDAGYLTGPRPEPLTHAGRAFEALCTKTLNAVEKRQVEIRLAAALAALPDHEPLLVRPLRELLARGAETNGALIGRLAARAGKRAWRPLGERWHEWHVVGPFVHHRGAKGIAESHPPERELRNMAAGGPGPDLEESFRGKGGRISWARLEVAGDGRDLDVGQVRFDKAIAPPRREESWTVKVAAYLYRRVELDEDREFALKIGSDDGIRLWANGELLADRGTSRGIELDEFELPLPLKAGVNHLLVKVANGDGAWGFRMSRPGGIDQPAIHQAIDRGVDYLLERQWIDGSWAPWHEYGVGYSALCVYTLLKSGLDAEFPAVRRGLAFVKSRRVEHTYSQSCKILALAAAGRDEDRGDLEELVDQLVDWQEGIGLYSYPIYPGGQRLSPDLSNTLYAALALNAASGHGIRVPARTWTGLVKGALACRADPPDGNRRRSETLPVGFGYRVNGGATGSMTTAALSVLVIARDQLGDEVDRKLGRRIDEAVAGGLAWLDREMTWSENPGQGRWHYFFLYGIERLGALLGTKILGKVNWYWSGAEYLVAQQNQGGAWRGRDSDRNQNQDTILALLFLNRATAPQTGGGRKLGQRAFSVEDPESEIQLRAIGDNPFEIWITGFSLDVREALVRKGASGAPVIERVRYVAREEGGTEERVLAEVLPEPGENVLQRFPARLRFDEAGRFEVFALATALKPAEIRELEPERVELRSAPLLLEVAEGAEWEALRYPTDRDRNLLVSHGKSFEASSQSGGHGADRAADGRHDTRWVCAPEDAAPWWKASFDRPVEAQYVLFSHALARALDREEPQPTRVEVILDGAETHRIELDPDPLAKTTLELPALREFRRIEVRVLESRKRAGGSRGVGFGEIEVLRQRD